MKAIEFTSLILCLLFSSCYTANFVEEPIVPFLPPLLKFQNGTRVTGVASWEERRLEVQSLLQNYILGTLPNTRGPKLTKVDVVNSSSYDQGDSQAFSTFLNLHFDTSDGGVVNAVSYEVELLFPRAQAGDKCPLFLTQWNHRNWALTALSRGYCAIVYPGSDVRDAAPTFQRAYPKASMMLILARAYVASITLDMFFYDIPGTAALPRILKDQICITGHSRNGKQSLLAASIDDRFSAVVGSSPGSPIASPYHMSSHNFYGEGPDAGRAGFWWLNSTLKYAAHPEKLPMDGHGVMASIAPRRAAIANGWTDHEGDISFADECNVRAAMEVYKLYNAEENLRIIHRPGDHHGFDDINTYIDYFDYGFGRLSKIFPLSWVGQTDTKTYPFPMSYLTPAGFDWDVWFDAFGKHTPPPPHALGSANLIDRIKWLLQLGDEPTVFTKGATYAEDSATGTFRYRSVMMGTDFENWKSKYKIHRQPLSFGNYVTANLFWAENATAKKQCPLVIWLHPFSYGTGYYASYIRGNPVVDLTQAGFCVLAFDHIGMATRVNEGGTNFYARHGPKASLFGQMVKDVKSALDAMECLTEEGRKNQSLCGTGSNFNGPYLPFPMPGTPTLDKSHFVLAGYSLGGNVALHAAALDNRVTAVASFAGFTPFKTDWNNKTTGGIKRLYSFHALIPRLGIFKDKYDEIPYDYDELLSSLIAPRPILLHTPMEDRDATFKDVNDCISLAKIAWEGKYADLFTHSISSGYTVMGKNESNILIEWLKKMQN